MTKVVWIFAVSYVLQAICLLFFTKVQNNKIHKQRWLLRLWIAAHANSLMLFLLAMTI